MTKKSRGFTLIELLVVIAIIGILAAIVLVSLTGARTKARDARIKADISQVRALAELVYNDADDYAYDKLCTGTALGASPKVNTYDTELNTIATDIDVQNGTDVDHPAPVCHASDELYCVSAVSASGGTICVSSAGQVGDDTCAAAGDPCAP